jgi:TolA-binding protein
MTAKNKDDSFRADINKGGHMKQSILIFILLFAFVLPGCSGDKAAELYNTAGFEELQNNREHALKLYEEIVEKYPDSEYAKKAEERIAEIKRSSKTR